MINKKSGAHRLSSLLFHVKRDRRVASNIQRLKPVAGAGAVKIKTTRYNAYGQHKAIVRHHQRRIGHLLSGTQVHLGHAIQNFGIRERGHSAASAVRKFGAAFQPARTHKREFRIAGLR